MAGSPFLHGLAEKPSQEAVWDEFGVKVSGLRRTIKI
jgi:hypothetical protein